MPSFDTYGWLSATEIPGRTTGIEPPTHGDKIVGEPYPNWTGNEWVLATYYEPPAPPAPAPNYGTKVTRLAFRNRFTQDEKRAIYTLAKTVIDVEIFLDDLQAVQTAVDLAAAQTLSSLQTLEAATILTSQRVQEIINNPVTPDEVP